VRQAHPRNRTRRRAVAACVALAVSGTAVLALNAMAAGSSATDARSPWPDGSIVAAVERSDRAEAPKPSIAAALAPAASSARAAAWPIVHFRPEAALPDVAPLVTPRLPAGSRAVVLGDSYTTGLNGAGLGSRNWTTIVGRSRGWTVVNLAVAGTGFMNRGWTNQPVRSLVSAAVRQRPDVVVLAAGHNDSRWSAAATGKEADHVIDRLHRSLPGAVIVIMAPIWQNGSPPARCLVLRDHLRQEAAAVGGIFIDPLAERWFAGANHRFIGADGLHPTNAGHRHIAELVLNALADVLPS
jgi:lysophospholipase L1-like esterase